MSDYWLSGCPAGGSVYEGYSLRVDDGVSWSGFDVGNGVGLSGVTPGKDLFFRVVLRAGTYSDLTFAPMLNAGLSAAPYSPYSNICPISGWTGANVTRTGVNVWDEEWELGGFNTSTGQPAPDTDRIRSKNAISVSPNTKYACDLWQFTSKGKIDGIGGHADLNVIVDSGKTLEWFLNPNYGTGR